ncbi:MAG: molybdopterin-binding protein, partial [Pseudomonadota bacterium]
MIFASLPPEAAEGAILAHSVKAGARRLRKGTVLGPADCAALAEAGIGEVVVARLGPQDVAEDRAAERIGSALAPDPDALGLTRTAPFTGRLNLYAARDGLLRVDAAGVGALNAVHEAVTLATLEPQTWVRARQMVATVKIIPYAAPVDAVAVAEALAAGAAGQGAPLLSVAPLARRSAGLVLTQTPGMKDSVLEKGAEAVHRRLRALGVTLAEQRRVVHEETALASALDGIAGDMVLILTGSATSDRADVGPGALRRLGGEILRFGMPVDPGNLLFLGRLAARPVIGLPGCARSPALNGADWVLERVAAGRDPDAEEIGAMGVGG